MSKLEEVIPEAEAAAYLDLQISTLGNWRILGRGPAYVKIGRSVFYRRCDIASWIAEQRQEPRPAAARRADNAA